MLTCKQCGSENIDGSKFCGSCGTSIRVEPAILTCRSCGTENPPTSKFCKNCGQPHQAPPLPKQPISQSKKPVTIDASSSQQVKIFLGIGACIYFLSAFIAINQISLAETYFGPLANTGATSFFLVFDLVCGVFSIYSILQFNKGQLGPAKIIFLAGMIIAALGAIASLSSGNLFVLCIEIVLAIVSFRGRQILGRQELVGV